MKHFINNILLIILIFFCLSKSSAQPSNCSYNDLSSQSNLVYNGDFQLGNTSFSTDYTFSTSNPLNASQYNIVTDASAIHFGFTGYDHTSGNGTGYFMVINGASTAVNDWCQTVSVQANSYYRFSAWFKNIVKKPQYAGLNIANVELHINGQKVSNNISLPDYPDDWVRLDTLWYSGSSTSVVLCIYDTSTAGNGNDFAIDDISLKLCSCPFSVNAGLDQIICKGDSAQLNATSDSTGTYLWSPNLNISDKNIANPKVAPPSLRKYLVTLTTSSGCIAKDSVNIFVTNISVDAGVNKTICKGDSIQLNATSAYTGTYLWSPKISISDTTIANPKVAPSTSTKYVVSLLSNGCKAKDSVQINVLDVTVNAGSDQTVCIGDSIQLNTSFTNATSFSWTPKAGLSDSTISNPFVKSTSSKQYILTAANGTCISRDTITISVVQCNSCTNCNTVTALNNGLVACYPFNGNANDETGHGNNGSPSSLSYSIDRFSELNASGDFSNSSSKVDVSPASFQLNSYTYSVWVKLNSTPASGQLYSILSIGSDKADQFLMVSNIIGQTGFGYGSYFANLTTPDRYWSASLPSLATWYHIVLSRSTTTLNFYVNGTLMDSRSTSSSTAAYGNPSVQTIIGARVGTPTTQHFDGNIDDLRIYNRTLSSTEIQSLYNLPTDRMHANAGPDVYSCKKDLIQLNGTGTGSFFTWSPIKYINNNIISNPTINPDTNITYILSVSNGTCLVFDTMKVFVTSIDANINNNDTSICLGDTVQFTTFINGDSYSWSPKMFINDTSSKSPFVFPNTTTNYILTVTRGTCIKKDSVKITVVKNIVADAGSDQQMCKGNTVQLSAFGPTGSVFSWLPNYALSNNSIPNPIANPLVDTSYFLKVHLGKNCVGYDTLKIKVNPNPTVDAGLDKDICREPFITIGVSSTLADSFYWTPPTGLSNINILQTQASPASNTTYFIKAINKFTGCFNFDTVTVSMIKPTASFSSDVQSGQLPLDVHFTNSSANSKTYFWDFGDTTATSTLINPNHIFTKEGLRKVMLVAENKGCTDTAYTMIDITGGLFIFIPNVITVNGDGLNDDFVISYTNGALKYLKGSIWNRWGGKIYDFEIPGGKWWDGKYKGVDCSEGVYFYIIEASDFADNVRTFHGTVTLLR